MTEIETLLQSPRYAGASAAYDAVVDAHGTPWEKKGYSDTHECKCGRTFTTSNGLGLHLGAIRRQAGRAFDAALPAR